MPVIQATFLGITQDCIGLVDLLHFFYSLIIIVVFIGVMLHGQIAVGLFDGGFVGVSIDAQNLIIITLCHRASSHMQLMITPSRIQGSLSPPERGGAIADVFLPALFRIPMLRTIAQGAYPPWAIIP